MQLHQSKLLLILAVMPVVLVLSLERSFRAERITAEYNRRFLEGSVNPFLDNQLRESYRERARNGFVPVERPVGPLKSFGQESETVVFSTPAPEQWDWRDHSIVSNVKFQGVCGTCWAFVATGMIEGRFAQDFGQMISLSEQHIMDCNRNDMNNGCSGGNFYSALKDWSGPGKNFHTEEKYPFIDDYDKQKARGILSDVQKDALCEATYVEEAVSKFVIHEGHIRFVEDTEEALKEAIFEFGPIGIAISGYSDAFMTYTGGVFEDDSCGNDPDHAALVVGYGTDAESGKDYWIVKNSWGPAWGEGGYIRLARGTQSDTKPYGECGILFQANYLEKNSFGCANSTGCSQFVNKQFCTETYGCQDDAFFASKFKIDSNGFIDFSGDEEPPQEGMAGGIIVLIVISVLLIAASIGYFVFTKYYKPHLNLSKTSHSIVVRQPEISPDRSEYRDQIKPFRKKLGEIEAYKNRAHTERAAVIILYLENHDGDVQRALEEYLSNES